MSSSVRFLHPAAAAQRLGVSPKALRLYEQRGLIKPRRSAAGWRSYGPAELARAAEIVALRAIGLSLAEIGGVLRDDRAADDRLQQALAAHEATLEGRICQLAGTVDRVRHLRAGLAQGRDPRASQFGPIGPTAGLAVAFDLPWPWGGERFELRDIRPLNYIVGPLGSGKTRLAMRLAETLPKAVFLGLDRLEASGGAARAELSADPALQSRVDQAVRRLVENGAGVSDALIALLVGLESEAANIVVVDMVEQGLDQPTQAALAGFLRRRGPGARPLFLLTRSCVILDLAAVGAEESILFCPANHSPPTRVAPYPGAPGFEAVASCLATPDVRARSAGFIAFRPPSSCAATASILQTEP